MSNEQQAPNNEIQNTKNKHQTTSNKQQSTNDEQRTINNEQQTTNNHQPIPTPKQGKTGKTTYRTRIITNKINTIKTHNNDIINKQHET